MIGACNERYAASPSAGGSVSSASSSGGSCAGHARSTEVAGLTSARPLSAGGAGFRVATRSASTPPNDSPSRYADAPSGSASIVSTTTSARPSSVVRSDVGTRSARSSKSAESRSVCLLQV